MRNDEIDRRIRVIDVNFDSFVAGLAKENVRANFGLALTQIGVGAAGALVAETASQILSAVSGGLAGAQAAYDKTVLYDQTFSALLAQMIASRKAVLLKIYEGRAASMEEYPLSAAVQDLDAYYFAGTLPGAVIATSADAKVKNDRAEEGLTRFRITSSVRRASLPTRSCGHGASGRSARFHPLIGGGESHAQRCLQDHRHPRGQG